MNKKKLEIWKLVLGIILTSILIIGAIIALVPKKDTTDVNGIMIEQRVIGGGNSEVTIDKSITIRSNNGK